MLKQTGDAGLLHVSKFGLTNYYNIEEKRHEYGFGLTDIIKKDTSGIKEGQGLRFENKEVLQQFLLKNPRITFNQNGMFMILGLYNNGHVPFVIVEYEEYAYSIPTKDLVFMALYDKKACEFHKRLV